MSRAFWKLAVVALFAIQPWALEARDLRVELVRGEVDVSASKPTVQLWATGSQGGIAKGTREGFGDVVVDLGEDSVWTLNASAEGYWSAPAAVTRGSESARLVLWPAGRLVGSLSWPDGEETPEILKVRFDPADPEDSKAVAGRDVCVLRDEGHQFVCVLPAGKHDFALRVMGYVSLYFWDQTLVAGEERKLGNLRLIPGSSVAGWLETEDGRPFDRTTVVELRPQLVSSGWEDPAKKLGRLDLSTKPNPKGFFHFAGVAEGLYSLRATQEGYADAIVEGVEVLAGYESRLPDPLVLGPPRELEVRVSPNTDTRGGHWHLKLVELRREKNTMVAMVDCDELGFAHLSGLRAGSFLLMVFEESADRPFYSAKLEIERPTTFQDIELPVVQVEGTLLLEDEPLSANLLFGGSFSASSAELHSDEDGNFRGFLPREGEWKVRIESEDPPILTTLRHVEVKRSSRQKVARTRIRLPDLRLAGRVVDEAFEPVRAMVLFRPEGAEYDNESFMTADDGTFELRGLPEGPVHVAAGAPGLASDELIIDLVKGLESPPLHLVVRLVKKIQGVVVSSEGHPVPGATVGMSPWGVLVGNSRSAVTNAQGSFEIELAESTRVAQVFVRAPGYALFGASHELSDVGNLVLEVKREWGELEINFPQQKEDWVQVARAGTSFRLPLLMHWARLHVNEGLIEPGKIVVPRLALGTYLVCLTEPGSAGWSMVYSTGQSRLDDQCVSVDLLPFSRQTVDLKDR